MKDWGVKDIKKWINGVFFFKLIEYLKIGVKFFLNYLGI